MFNKQNFCHVASNNRNEQKAGIFVYRTTDNLATVLASGYFNEKLVDINLHDIIIHEQTDNADKTKVQKNVLCVTERTLDNVGTTLVKSQWEEDIESAVESMQDDIEIIQGDIDDIKAKDIEQDERLDDIESGVAYKATDFKTPITSTNKGITQTEETALNNKIDLAANSGRMITDQGVWYAKMYAATVAPAAEDGTNYADFSQTDGQGNPIIVIYSRVSGAWVQSETITPPAEYDGYVPITSKIWDIVEQSGQQGGRVLWNHQSKDFTPYPQIISFENAALTGVPTAPLPTDASPNDQIATKEYVDSHSSTGSYHPTLFAHEWDDKIRNDVQWLRADTFSWQSGTVYEAAFNELFNDIYKYTTWYLEGEYLLRTYSPTPSVGDQAYLNSEPNPVPIGLVQAYDSVNNTITVNNKTYAYNSSQYVTPVTETVAGITVTYYPGTSGRKIVAYADMTAVESVYTATGVAWYYIIDMPGKQFKLPRTKFGFTGLRDTVGKYVAPGLPNITGTIGAVLQESHKPASGALYYGDNTTTDQNSNSRTAPLIALDASRSSSIYGNSTTVQPPATQMYLYFYVGEFTQEAIANTAGLNTEDFNDKADTDFGNTNMIDYVVAKQDPSAGNGYTWYRKYKSGWVEQGGTWTGSWTVGNGTQSAQNITLPVAMQDGEYHPLLNFFNMIWIFYGTQNLTTTGFSVIAGGYNNSRTITKFNWRVSGMSAN